MDLINQVKKSAYIGLFFITLSTLMYEILLTRIFSVTMWYHFAFMAVSIAMFGMTVGAVVVYLLPSFFTQEKVKKHLAISALFFSISIVLSFLIYLAIPLPNTSIIAFSFLNLIILTLIYSVISIPFIFSGICACLALTKFSRQVSSLYAVDLLGAAIGCLLLAFLLNIITGPTAVVVLAALSSVGAAFFATEANTRKLKRAAVIISVFFILFAAANTILVGKNAPLLRLTWVKGGLETGSIYEKWNAFSRITVFGNKNNLVAPFGWGFSPTHPPEEKIGQLDLFIDANAFTPLTGFSGDLKKVEFLKYDIVNLVHYLRNNAKVLVIGSGGGRDVLSALVFGQKQISAVEVNKNIINALNQQFGDFTGHLDQNPKVHFIHNEARSYIANSKEKFDIIQASLIDTWAATVAGAFVLTEDSLYTVEAWEKYLEHLTPSGILTFSRWYFRDQPGEMYRLTSLAVASLKQFGIEDPRQHIIIVRRMGHGNRLDLPDGVGTILVSKEPFSENDLNIIEDLVSEMGFELVLSPRFALDPNFAVITSGEKYKVFIDQFPINISAPTDNSPFFFVMLRLKNVFNGSLWEQGKNDFSLKAVAMIGFLLIITVVFSLLCIILPLVLKGGKVFRRTNCPLILYFLSIGIGFMLIEISQMQRLIIFLGNPIYSLSVVLFSLLFSSGLGSYLTQKIDGTQIRRSATRRLIFLLAILAIFGLFTSQAVQLFYGATIIIKIIITVIILSAIGIFMGMAFPLGMKIASIKSEHLTPLLWGVNGAASVFASVLAVAIALSFNISTAFWIGVIFYIFALITIIWGSSAVQKSRKTSEF
jgi:hypothetical protein